MKILSWRTTTDKEVLGSLVCMLERHSGKNKQLKVFPTS